MLLILISSLALAVIVTVDPYADLNPQFDSIEVYDYTSDDCRCDCYNYEYY